MLIVHDETARYVSGIMGLMVANNHYSEICFKSSIAGSRKFEGAQPLPLVKTSIVL